MVTDPSILAWRHPWTEEPGGLQPMGSQRVQYDGVTNTFTSTLLHPNHSSVICLITAHQQQCTCAPALSRVQLFAIPWTRLTRPLCPWDFPGKNTGRVAISFSGRFSRPWGQTHISCLAGGLCTTEPPGKPHTSSRGPGLSATLPLKKKKSQLCDPGQIA